MSSQVKHPRLFFDDGNIIIIASSENVKKYETGNVGAGGDVGDAKGSPGTVLFCVHKSMLALQSQAFESMFNVAAGELGDHLEERPTVTLPDPAEDIEAMLNSFYNPASLPYQHHDPYTSIRVHRALHMATKYQCNAVRSRIVNHLKQDWPTTVFDFTLSEKAVRDLKRLLLGNIDMFLPEPAASYNLGKLFDIPEILPATFYVLTTLKPYQDFDDHRSDVYKNHDTQKKDEMHPIHGEDRTARFKLLDGRYEAALQKWRKFIRTFVIGQNYVYESSGSCLLDCEEVMEMLWESKKNEFRWATDVFGVLDDTTEMENSIEPKDDFRKHGVCEECESKFINDLYELKEQLWKEITRIAKSA